MKQITLAELQKMYMRKIDRRFAFEINQWINYREAQELI